MPSPDVVYRLKIVRQFTIETDAKPVAMTSLAAAFALLPLALGIGQGAAMQRPLAIAIISGLAMQLPMVLITLPVLLHGLKSIRERIGR
jgi:multidrug efflux pump subunit AcrB